jgi:hypothetical protein
MSSTTILTWQQLVAAEPRLGSLMREIKTVRDDKSRPSFCANAVWYGYYDYPGFKPRLYELAGWGAKSAPDLLRTMEAYDLAYDKLYAALPNCRNCNCM